MHCMERQNHIIRLINFSRIHLYFRLGHVSLPGNGTRRKCFVAHRPGFASEEDEHGVLQSISFDVSLLIHVKSSCRIDIEISNSMSIQR